MRTLDQLEAEYFQQHPEEVDEYLAILFETMLKMAILGPCLRLYEPSPERRGSPQLLRLRGCHGKDYRRHYQLRAAQKLKV